MRSRLFLAILALLLAALALVRPIDHAESQYVAAIQLAGHGLLPYRDFAYFHMPLQPMLFAVLNVFGVWLWPVTRIVSGLLGAIAAISVYSAARRAGAGPHWSLAGALAFGVSNGVLAATGLVRGEALPLACVAAALLPILRAEAGTATRGSALLAGLLLAAAAAANLPYAAPAIAYGVYAATRRAHRPAEVLVGALPMLALIGWTWQQAPANFMFEAIAFPWRGPAQHLAEIGSEWQLSVAAKILDMALYLALGAALSALWLAARHWRRVRRLDAIDVMILAGLVAALLPTPTRPWSILPMLPLLFVRLALTWSDAPPKRWAGALVAAFVIAGLVPTALALTNVASNTMLEAVREGRMLRAAMDQNKVPGPVATLSPQFMAATARLPDVRFAPGPFYFRSHGLLTREREIAAALVSAPDLEAALVLRPSAVLVGGESEWSGGDDRVDAALERWAQAHGYARATMQDSRLRLYVPSRQSP